MSNTFRPSRLTLCLLSFLYAILVCTQAVLALDPNKAITQYIHDAWEVGDALSQNIIQAIVQTRDGYLWIGTRDGLARFDGVRFTMVPGPKNSDIRALLEDQEGSLWVGLFGGGLGCWKDNKLTVYTTKEGLSNNQVLSIYEAPQGDLWIGTYGGGVNRLRNGEFTTFAAKQGLASDWVMCIYGDQNGGIWIGTEGGGLSRWTDGEFTSYTKRRGLSNDNVYAVRKDREGNLWAGTYGGGLNRWKNGRFTAFTTQQGLSKNQVMCLYEDRDGNIWIGTDGGGVNRWRNQELSSYTTRDGLTNDTVTSIYEDREGSLWIGTWGGGLNRLRDGKFTVYTTREGLSSDRTASICEDREGNVWIGTDGGGVNRLRNGKFKSYSVRDGLSSDWVFSVFGSRDGNLWIGTWGGGLDLLRGGKLTHHAFSKESSNDGVISLYEDRRGTLWIGTNIGTNRSGLSRWEKGKFTSFTGELGLSSNRVISFYEDQQGSLWIGTSNGLNRLAGGNITTYTTRQGLADNLVHCIYGDSSGILWIGTGGGLNRFREGTLSSFKTPDRQFEEAIFQILEDGKENLWMAWKRGILRVNKRDLNAWAAGKTTSIPTVLYGKPDGLRSGQQSAVSRQPSAWKARDGKLWFTTSRGVVMIDPDNISANKLLPPVVIERLIIDQNPLDLSRPVQLPAGHGQLEAHYTALSFLAPEKVNFRYQLEGFDEDWVEAGTRRVAYYTNLPPGHYRFRVKACNNDGVWNETGASLSFSLAPHFYQAYWFYGICSAGVILLGASAYRFRIHQGKVREKKLLAVVDKRTQELQEEIGKRRQAEEALQESLKDLERRVQERTAELSQLSARLLHLQDEERRRIARELHDSTGQSLVALAMNLASINGSSSLDPNVRQTLSDSLALAEQCSQEIRVLSYLLHPPMLDEAGLAGALRWYAAGFTQRSGIRVDLEMSPDLDRLPDEVEIALFRIVQESFANIHRHSNSPTAKVRIAVDSKEVMLEIADHGSGMSPTSSATSLDRTTAKIGVGIAGMRERIRQLQGRLEISSNEQGTTVRAVVPLNGTDS